MTIGLLAGVATFAAVFVQGLLSPGLLSGNVLELGGIGAGSARLAAWGGRPVWLVHRSEEQLHALPVMSGHVTLPGAASSPVDNPYRSLRRSYGIYLAQTARSGILVQYTSERPAALDPDMPWQGGFVDPASEAVFDVAGRRYRNTPGGPLAVPPHRFESDSTVSLGEW